MIDLIRSAFRGFPSWSSVSIALCFGIAMIGFGNGDRLVWKLTSHGAELPGIVLDVRSYRGPDGAQPSYIPKIAFRDASGTVKVAEVSGAPLRYPLTPDAPVLVAWDEEAGSLQIDVPFKRHPLTTMISRFFTLAGVSAWLCAIWLIGRRIVLSSHGMRETS